MAERSDVLVVLVLGATHPHVLRDAGDTYRESLQDLVRERGLEGHVTFVDSYVELEELRLHLSAPDVHLTPHHGADQIVSGTLAYAVGMGCAVVSTPGRQPVVVGAHAPESVIRVVVRHRGWRRPT